ncbi:hypothetical protein [Euzebya sp.]|uniref:hypothetical protein n=1 Tax=Euzebya sp. TaxID=1971409 RepID=UPI0035159523
MDHIPSLLSPYETPPIRTADDLHLHWRRLMGELGFATRCLWVTILDPLDLVVPTLPRLEDLPAAPPEAVLRTFVHALAEALGGADGRWSVGFLLSRHDPPSVTASDLRYRDVLRAAARAEGMNLRPMHLATSDAVIGLDVAEAA